MIFQNQDPLTNYHALESLLEPKAVMMGDIFAHHWAFRIPRKKAKKLLSLNKWKDDQKIIQMKEQAIVSAPCLKNTKHLSRLYILKQMEGLLFSPKKNLCSTAFTDNCRFLFRKQHS